MGRICPSSSSPTSSTRMWRWRNIEQDVQQTVVIWHRPKWSQKIDDHNKHNHNNQNNNHVQSNEIWIKTQKVPKPNEKIIKIFVDILLSSWTLFFHTFILQYTCDLINLFCYIKWANQPLETNAKFESTLLYMYTPVILDLIQIYIHIDNTMNVIVEFAINYLVKQHQLPLFTHQKTKRRSYWSESNQWR